MFVNDARIATTANGTTNWSTFALLRLGANTIRAVAYDFVGQSSSTSISFTYAPPPPPNDNFDDAIALLGDSGIVTADTTQCGDTLPRETHSQKRHSNSAMIKAPCSQVIAA